jgi:5-amino-6-(5-phosphoribosylamino)uracil reductase
VISFNTQNNEFNWIDILEHLFNLSLHHIAVLGGGKLIASLLSAGLIDEWYITLCPLILGGKTAPSFVEGIEFLEKEAPFWELIDTKIVNNEMFLHYKRTKNKV